MEYGQTPWDNMTKEELKMEVWKLYDAANSARSCLRMIRCSDEHSLFWTKGTGFKALDWTEKAMKTGLDLSDEEREILWKGFFRNAIPLLFNDPDWNWRVCDKCQQWFCGFAHEPKKHKCILCDNENLRPIEWKDFYNGDLPK